MFQYANLNTEEYHNSMNTGRPIWLLNQSNKKQKSPYLIKFKGLL